MLLRKSHFEPHGELLFEAAEEATPLISRFNRATNNWDFPQLGPFWSAVRMAHDSGYYGQGKCIGIIDSSFDLSIRKLQQQAELKSDWSVPEDCSDHGTVVALLISTIAPSAHLHLYATAENSHKANLAKVEKALNLAGESDVQLINLSCGRPFDQRTDWEALWQHLRFTKEHCSLCRIASDVCYKGKLIIAAVGNSHETIFCPARLDNVFGIGFQTDLRETEETDEGIREVSTAYLPSGYKQSSDLDYTIKQPPGVLGSSFAAPLVTGALALTEKPEEFPKVVAAAKAGAIAALLHPYLRVDPSPKNVRLVGEWYNKALSLLPHRHENIENTKPCTMCSIFLSWLFIDAGLYFLECKRFDTAKKLLSVARWLAPWSADAAATAAKLLLEEAKFLGSRGEIIPCVILLSDARREYQRALVIRHDKVYLCGLSEVDDWLDKYGVPKNSPLR